MTSDETFPCNNLRIQDHNKILMGIMFIISYLPTPTLGLDMTQGQFFKQSLSGFNSEMKLMSQVQILAKATCVSHHTKALKRGMNLSLLSSADGAL